MVIRISSASMEHQPEAPAADFSDFPSRPVEPRSVTPLVFVFLFLALGVGGGVALAPYLSEKPTTTAPEIVASANFPISPAPEPVEPTIEAAATIALAAPIDPIDPQPNSILSAESGKVSFIQQGEKSLVVMDVEDLARLLQTQPVVAAIVPSPESLTPQPPEQVALVEPVETPAPEVVQPAPIKAKVAPSCVDILRTIAARSVIYFGSGSAELTEDSAPKLSEIGEAIDSCDKAVVHVTGHSDNLGSEEINLNLSWQRADNTVAALESLGFDTSSVDPVGFGVRMPATQGDTSDADMDRRVEFHILEKH